MLHVYTSQLTFKCESLTCCFYCGWIWFKCVYIHCVHSMFLWMHGEMEYKVSIWLRKPLTKGASKAEWQSKLCGFMLHKAHPEGPTSSWNFKQSGVRAAVLLENWRDGSFFRSLTYSEKGDVDWTVFICGECQTVIPPPQKNKRSFQLTSMPKFGNWNGTERKK